MVKSAGSLYDVIHDLWILDADIRPRASTGEALLFGEVACNAVIFPSSNTHVSGVAASQSRMRRGIFCLPNHMFSFAVFMGVESVSRTGLAFMNNVDFVGSVAF